MLDIPPEVLTTVAPGIAPAITAVIVLFLTQWFDAKKRTAERDRWYAAFFLSRKLDALQKLHTELVDWHFTLNRYANYAPATIEEYAEKVLPKEDQYLRAKVIADTYLDPAERQVMANALGAFRRVAGAIHLSSFR